MDPDIFNLRRKKKIIFWARLEDCFKEISSLSTLSVFLSLRKLSGSHTVLGAVLTWHASVFLAGGPFQQSLFWDTFLSHLLSVYLNLLPCRNNSSWIGLHYIPMIPWVSRLCLPILWT